jgi:hypothetical protein
MKKMVSSLITLGAGMAIYRSMSNNGMLSGRNMRKIKRTIMKSF